MGQEEKREAREVVLLEHLPTDHVLSFERQAMGVYFHLCTLQANVYFLLCVSITVSRQSMEI